MTGNLAAGRRSFAARTEPSPSADAADVDEAVAVLGELLGLRRAAAGDAVTHLALPNAANPKFYVPVTHRKAAVASCLAYNGLRPPSIARRRAAVGWGLRFGLVQRMRGTPMTSGTPSGRFAASEGDPRASLVDELARRLGYDEPARPRRREWSTRSGLQRFSCSTGPEARWATPRWGGPT